MPGYALVISHNDASSTFKTKLFPISVNTKKSICEKYSILYTDIDSAVNAYGDTLVESMRKRVGDFKKIGIVFSGGIDRGVFVAYLAKQMAPEVICYTSGIKDSSDILNSLEIAEKLDLKLEVEQMTVDVENTIPKIINIIEDDNMGQVEVAIPIYGAVKLAHEQGIRVMLTGQQVYGFLADIHGILKLLKNTGMKKFRGTL